MTTQDLVATAERIKIGYDEETAYGVKDATPTLKLIEAVSEGLKQNTSYQKSRTLVDDRMVRSLIRTDVTAGGPTEHEMQYSAFDDWLEAALMSAAWSTKQQVVMTDAVLVAAVGGLAKVQSALSDMSVFSVGQWVKLKGLTTATNNDWGKVTASSAAEISVRLANAAQDFTGVLTAQSGTCTQGEQVVNGTTFRSFSFEMEYSDLASEFRQITGGVIDRFSLGIETEALPNLGFEWSGKIEDSAAATFGDGSPTAAIQNTILNSIDHVKRVLEGQNATLTNLDTTQVGMTLNNGLRPRKRIGVLGPTSIGLGIMGTEGTLRAHYISKALMDKALDDVTTGLAFILNDGGQSADGNAYVVDQPSIKFTDGQRVAGGQDTDILSDMSYESFKDSSESIVLRIQRWATADT